MGLFDIVGDLIGGQAGGNNASSLASTALEFINNQPGGLSGLVSQFQQGGAGDIINSWISHGENQPISADTLQNVLGSDTVNALASKAGIDPQQASSLLAQVLPHVVNGATPNGQVPADGQVDSSNVLGSLAQLAGGLFGNKQS
jgi:uncharacterized protein YidB (DUF937 family)